MASLSDQIDRLTQSTRAIQYTVASTENNSTGVFTRVVLDTHIGDIIREVDPTELGLFSLVNNHYEQEHQLHRIQFSGATPLRNKGKNDIDPEIYAHAALKCIRQYQPIRPMPRAYDQIVAILDRFKVVRDNLHTLHANFRQTVVNDVPPAKSRIEHEERRIKELQNRMEELAKRKGIALKIQRTTSDQESPEVPCITVPSSPQEEKFWTTPIGPSRTLRFADNLMDEHVDFGDISTTSSFQSPLPMQPTSNFGQLSTLRDTVLFDAPFMSNLTQEDREDEEEEENDDGQEDDGCKELTPTVGVDTSATPTDVNKKPNNQTAETPRSRKRRIRVNVEVERIIAKIWSTVGDVVIPSGHSKPKSGSLSTDQIIDHLQQLAMQSPRPESPVASSVSSTSIEGSSPTFQQILTAHLLMLLLSAPPHYSLSLTKVKDNLAAKAKEGGTSGAGQSTTRVLYGCVAKRLVKIDRGGGEQIVKFDI